MHKLNVRILGPSSFISTLNELKIFLKFNPLLDNSDENFDIILFHVDVLENKKQKAYINSSNSIKICARARKEHLDDFDISLELPTTLAEINATIGNAAAKKKFNLNSSIEIKSYLLNKNEKKLSKENQFIILTEKEIQLIELFLNTKKPISKDNILSSVWNYSSDADTHTVETHIYRLRKKISDKFMDEKFILNNKDGYYF
jgi:phosphoribosyl-dephospho-CoA transferase